MKIERLRIKNYRALREVRLDDLPPMAVFVGPNGSGKSTLFDIFGFLRDSLQHNVRQALARRGGFKEVVTREHEGEPIEIEIKLREEPGQPLVTYELHGIRPQDTFIILHDQDDADCHELKAELRRGGVCK